MGSKLNTRDMALYRAIDEVLDYVWDPIGIAHFPQARDEYYGYLPHVFRMLQDGATAEAIASHLGEVVESRMSLPSNTEGNMHVARLLCEWRDFLLSST